MLNKEKCLVILLTKFTDILICKQSSKPEKVTSKKGRKNYTCTLSL